MKLLIGITGSIGVMNIPIYLIYLKEYFSSIKVIMTKSAKHFTNQDALSLLGCEIYSDMFPLSQKQELSQVQLAKWADLFIILPATANILAETAHGLAGSLLTTAVLCHAQPILFFPNMNDAMWAHPATTRNVSVLREMGHVVFDPVQQTGFEEARGEKVAGGYMPNPVDLSTILLEEVEKRKKIHLESLHV